MGKRSNQFGRAVTARAALVVVACALLSTLAPTAHAQGLGCTPDPTWGTPEAALGTDVFTVVNLHRTSLGRPSLQVSQSLTRAAEWKAAHMAETGLFSHDDPGRAWDQRIRDCGYQHPAVENIGFGYPSAADMLAAWLLSTGHRTNIEDPGMVATGVAAVRNSAGLVYWVQVFGTQLDPSDTGSPPEGPDEEEPNPTPTPTDSATPPPDGGATNTPPIAVDDLRRVKPRKRTTIVVLANDSDPDGDQLVLRGIVTKPRHGRAIFDPTDGTIKYRARRGTAGRNDRLTYRVGDGYGGTDVGEVRIRIRR